MAKRGGGFGMIMLAVVTAIVLMLVARGLRETAPVLLDLDDAAVSEDPRLPAEAADALDSLPGLDDVRRGTDRHAQDVQDALKQID